MKLSTLFNAYTKVTYRMDTLDSEMVSLENDGEPVAHLLPRWDKYCRQQYTFLRAVRDRIKFIESGGRPMK